MEALSGNAVSISQVLLMHVATLNIGVCGYALFQRKKPSRCRRRWTLSVSVALC